MALHRADEIVDPGAARIDRLKAQLTEFKDRATKWDEVVAEHTEFKTAAISRLAGTA